MAAGFGDGSDNLVSNFLGQNGQFAYREFSQIRWSFNLI
jgi:hypothetical protein